MMATAMVAVEEGSVDMAKATKRQAKAVDTATMEVADRVLLVVAIEGTEREATSVDATAR
jgi:hypothetical protein